MCRRARSSLVATIVFTFVLSVWNFQPVNRARASTLPNRIYLPGIVVSPPFWSTDELRAVDVINQQRKNAGCPAVQINRELSVAAKQHSQDMATNRYFSHIGQDGSSFGQRARIAGYTYQPSGEIISAGRTTADATVNDWMGSPPHCSIILTCANDDIGIGLSVVPNSVYQYYWTVVFGQR